MKLGSTSSFSGNARADGQQDDHSAYGRGDFVEVEDDDRNDDCSDLDQTSSANQSPALKDLIGGGRLSSQRRLFKTFNNAGNEDHNTDFDSHEPACSEEGLRQDLKLAAFSKEHHAEHGK